MYIAPPPKLLDQVRNLMRMPHMSHKTERAYVGYCRDYILFHNKRHPSEMGADEIRDYLTYLAVEKKVAASTQNVAFNALLFLYKQVLEIELPIMRRCARQRPERLPTVLTPTHGLGTVRTQGRKDDADLYARHANQVLRQTRAGRLD